MPNNAFSHHKRLATITAIAGAGTLVATGFALPVQARQTFASIEALVSCATSSACQTYRNTGSGNGVAGIAVHGSGVTGTATTGVGTGGSSSSGIGVLGISKTNTGVYGSSTSGDGVSATSKSATGVAGKSVNGIGVLGVLNDPNAPSAKEAAVSAQAVFNGVGLAAYSQNYQAIVAQSDYDTGIDATGLSGGQFFGTEGDGIDATSSGSGSAAVLTQAAGSAPPALSLTAGASGSAYNAITAFNSSNDSIMRLDDVGDLTISGYLTTAGSCSSGCAKTRVVSYAPREAGPTMEDVGNGQLVRGHAYIRLDPAFANVIDRNVDYHVLVTPEGDSNGLYVTQRSAQAFSVRENRDGRSTLGFSYRIVATPFGGGLPRLQTIAARPTVPPGNHRRHAFAFPHPARRTLLPAK